MKNILLSAIAFICFVCSCNHTTITDCFEIPKPDCICTKEYKPVCGCNDKTYDNECMAKCAGIQNYTEGKCK